MTSQWGPDGDIKVTLVTVAPRDCQLPIQTRLVKQSKTMGQRVLFYSLFNPYFM